MPDTERREVAIDVLVIGGGFFGYAKEIIGALERRGRSVAWFEDRPALDTYTKAAIRLAPALVAGKARKYFDGIIERMRGQPIAEVLVIKGEALSCATVARLRAAFPAARFTLYFWDSYGNMPKDSPMKVAAFDRAFTFDPNDARSDPRLVYRPLFFIPEYANLPGSEAEFDFLFIGTAHTDRYAVLKRLSRALPESARFKKVLYFPSRLVYAARRIFDSDFWGSDRHEFIFTPLSRADVKSLISRARVVVDIERTSQRGLTMRTIEMFGAGRKLVTTNAGVVDTDIYDASNIAVIDRDRPTVSAAFLDEPYAAPPRALLERYSLRGWLDEVLPSRQTV